jgi:2-amino-4-hydroxy-6-hydroxymethyldihydropteridine diphosphokinase
MILIALGANLEHPEHGSPRATLEAALAALEARGLRTLQRSRWYQSAAWPASDQPDYVNGAALVDCDLGPEALLEVLHEVEANLGRVRGEANAARTADLDLLAYHQEVRDEPDGLVLPHPRLQDRVFVLLPLMEVAPGWRHPVTGQSVAEMARALPPDPSVRLLLEDSA